MQSPKSKRPKAPCEGEVNDGLPKHIAPHTSPPAKGGQGARAPAGQEWNGRGFKGGVPDCTSTGASRSVTPAYHPPAGRPGYVESEDAKRHGGTAERFTKETQ